MLVIRGFLISMFLKWHFDEDFSSSRSKAREENASVQSDSDSSGIQLRIFRQFTRNFRRGRLSSRDLCMLTGCKVSIPEEIRESNPGHFDMSRDTWEVARWKSDRVMGFDRVVWVRKRTCHKDLRARCRMMEFSSAGFLEWFNLDSIQIWKRSRWLRSIGNIFRASKAAAGWCYGNYVKHKKTGMFQLYI